MGAILHLHPNLHHCILFLHSIPLLLSCPFHHLLVLGEARIGSNSLKLSEYRIFTENKNSRPRCLFRMTSYHLFSWISVSILVRSLKVSRETRTVVTMLFFRNTRITLELLSWRVPCHMAPVGQLLSRGICVFQGL